MAIGAAVLLSTTSKDLGANAQAAAQQKVADVTLDSAKNYKPSLPNLRQLGIFRARQLNKKRLILLRWMNSADMH